MDVQTAREESFVRRWALLFGLGALILVVTILQPYRNGPAIRSDGVGYHIWTYALLRRDLTFSWVRKDPGAMGLIRTVPRQQRFIDKYPPGVALIRLPWML